MRKFIFGSMAILLSCFAACSDEQITTEASGGPGLGGEIGRPVYLNFDLRPYDGQIALRSATTDPSQDYSQSEDGTETGLYSESNVSSVIIVLATKDKNEFLVSSEVTGVTPASVADGTYDATYNITAKIDADSLQASFDDLLYAGGGDSYPEVNVYAFCNYTVNLVQKLRAVKRGDTDWINTVGELTEGRSLPGTVPAVTNAIWSTNSFLMSNARICTVNLPKKDEWVNYTDITHPFNLMGENAGSVTNQPNPILVERTCARLDYRAHKDYPDGVYPLLTNVKNPDEPTKKESLQIINVEFSRMSLVNMNKNIYYLRRVSDDGLAGGAQLCKPETRTNYVVAPKAQDKHDDKITVANSGDYFNFPLFKKENGRDVYNSDGWFTSNIKDEVLSGQTGQWTGASDQPYHIWRYITENTIPKGGGKATGGVVTGEDTNQKFVNSTGIVFMANLRAGKDINSTYKVKVEGGEDYDQRYVSEKVTEALTAAEYHVMSANDSKAGGKKSFELKDTADMKRNPGSYQYEYPALYEFQGNLYAGFDELVVSAFKYDGPGGTLYETVSDILAHYFFDVDEFETGSTAATKTYVFRRDDEMYKNFTAEQKGRYVQLTPVIYAQLVGEKFEAEEKTEGGASTTLNAQSAKNFYFGYTASGAAVGTIPERAEDAVDKHFSVELVQKAGEKYTEEEMAAFKRLVSGTSKTTDRITMYDATYDNEFYGGKGWGYYCYYFYWLRHNDNGRPGIMGPMEFASVRNNVYKLQVTKVSKLGHPIDIDNDPTPPGPDDPDEDPNVYIEVDVNVLPWVVRKNDIEF